METDKLAELKDETRTEYVIGDLNNPNSVENLVSNIPTVARAIERIKQEVPDLLTLDEGTFKEKLRPTLTLNRIRMSFWQEYENAVQTGRKIRLAQMIGGICTEYYFQEKVQPSNEKMAYILCPPTNYTVQVKEALQAGMETLREIVSAKVIDDDGFLIPRAADVVIKAVALLDMRVKGAIVQRIDQRSLNLNMNRDISPKEQLPQSMDELDAMIAQTKEKLKEIQAAPVRELPMNVEQVEVARQIVDVAVERTGGTKRFTPK